MSILSRQPLFPSSCCHGRCPIDISTPCMRNPCATEKGNHRSVDGQLHAMEQREICNHLQSAVFGCVGAAMSKSRTYWLTETRPPASRHTRAAADSKAKPRRPNTPTLAHVARWWPEESRRRPHPQVRLVRGRGSQRRRKRSTRNTSGAKRAWNEDGQQEKGNSTRRPP